MRRPWQIWLTYTVSVTLAVIALAWLTRQVLELDRAEAAARVRSELDELAGAALWRMDVEMSHLLAVEVGRPVSAYQPVIHSGGKGADADASPLLVQPSEFVQLHFEVDDQGRWVSPQVPEEADNQFALDNGTTLDNIQRSRERLDLLRRSLAPERLLARLPDEMFIYNDPPELASNYAFNPPPQTFIANANAAEAQQMAREQLSQQQAGVENPEGASRNGYGGYGANQAPQGRAASEYNRRFNTLQTAARQALDQQREFYMESPSVSLSRSQPFWDDDRLLVARRVVTGPRQMAQGVWLHWPSIRERLLEEVRDLLPNAQLTPVSGDSAPLNRLLASVPVQLVVPEPELLDPGLTPMRMALLVSWACFAAGALAVGVLLHGVLQLSERRASFVSAVTHELRTPLTTFRMYSEMLSEGMVQPDQRQSYLETLKGEADRLSHLVENVLHYARLERSKSGWDITPVRVASLLEMTADRLETRARQAGLELKLECDAELEDRAVSTNLAAVEQILFNLVDNACKYAAPSDPERLEITLRREGEGVAIAVRDFGPGVPADQRRRLFQPFSRTKEVGPAPGVGLGLALCRRLASQLGARLRFEPQEPGARFTLRLPLCPLAD